MGMIDAFLSPGSQGDVANLTGAHTRTGQVKNLVQNGIRHSINAAGWPVVLWANLEGGRPVKAARSEWKPNKAA